MKAALCIAAAGVAAALSLTAGAVGAQAYTSNAPVPASLSAAESSAEDLVDGALAGRRGEVISIAAELKATANGPAASALEQAGVSPAAIAQLEQRANRVAQLARGGSFVSVMLAANAVSQLMPGLYAHFADPVPPRILTLDYLDREAQFRSLAHQPSKVAAAVKELEATWVRVRPKVVAAGGTSEAAAYAEHVAAMKRLDPAAASKLQAEAVHGLALVDELEQVFG